MTQSLMSNNVNAMLNVTTDLFDQGSRNYKKLNAILAKLELIQDTIYIHAIFSTLKCLLQHGIEVDYVPKHDHLGNKTISKQWNEWSSAIEDSITKYERITPHSFYADLVIPEKLPNESLIINILLHTDLITPSDNTSSNIQGVKLILLSLLMMPNNSTDNLNFNNIIKSFASRINDANKLKISLDFTKKIPLMAIAEECEILIQGENKRHGSYRKFLTSLRDSLIILDGYFLGRRDSKKLLKQKNTSREGNTNKRIPKTVRFSPFYCPSELYEYKNIGDMFEIVGDEGEESTIGIIEIANAYIDSDDVSDEAASAIAQVKSKQWIQDFHEATPWNSRGINPFTQQILISWIRENNTTVSLLYGLMLCTGRKYEEIMSMTIGDDADLTKQGEYIRYYIAPENSFKPSSNQESLLEKHTQSIRLQLPDLIKIRFCEKCKHSTTGQTVTDAWKINHDELKKELQKITKSLIKNGANGLAIDRIPLTLQKRVAIISSDNVIGHILASRKNDMPPVSSYYAAYTHDEIISIYQKAVEELY